METMPDAVPAPRAVAAAETGSLTEPAPKTEVLPFPEIVAMVDDHIDDLRDWCKEFEDAGIRTAIFDDRAAFEHSVERGDFYDAIILDWLFAGEDSSISRLILEGSIALNCFVPVFVYTENPEVADSELEDLRCQPGIPYNHIQVYAKAGVSPAELALSIKNWYATSTGTRVARAWRTARRKSFEQALYQLDTLEGENLRATLQHLIIAGEDSFPDVNHSIEFLERFVSRGVSADADFRMSIQKILDEGRLDPAYALKLGSMPLMNAHRYIQVAPGDTAVQTGDVIDLYEPDGTPLNISGVVVTPACDLDQRKCRELRILLVQQNGPQPGTKPDQWWQLKGFLRPGSTTFENLWLNFHRAIILIDKAMQPSKEKKNLYERVLTYDKVYEDEFHKQVLLRPLCHLDDPYRSDLLQKYSSHAARIGVPD
jgi:hypothetical protein